MSSLSNKNIVINADPSSDSLLRVRCLKIITHSFIIFTKVILQSFNDEAFVLEVTRIVKIKTMGLLIRLLNPHMSFLVILKHLLTELFFIFSGVYVVCEVFIVEKIIWLSINFSGYSF